MSQGPEILTQCSTPPVCHVTHVICHMSHVWFQVSGVTCQVSHLTCNSQTIRAREPKFYEKVHLLSPVTCHMSHVICHMSLVIYTFFYQWCHSGFFEQGIFCIMVEFHREGSAINGATPSSFLPKRLKLIYFVSPSHFLFSLRQNSIKIPCLS